jgi:hypothetical protein
MSEDARQPESHAPTKSPPTANSADAQLCDELDRRLCELATYPATAFGPLGSRDLIFTIVLFVLLPLSLVWVLR